MGAAGSKARTPGESARSKAARYSMAASKDSAAALTDPKKRGEIEDEIADVVIYALEFANIGGIDLAKAIGAKLAKNAAKYPVEKSRGRSVKYTEL